MRDEQKLELQTDELWQTHQSSNDDAPGDKFWKRYEKLIKAARKTTHKLPVVRQDQVLDTLTAYEQLPHRHYDDLFKQDKAFSWRSLAASAIVSLNGINLLPFYKSLGVVAIFGGALAIRYLVVSIFKTGQSFSVDIQPYHLQLDGKHKKRKVLLQHIADFSIRGEVIQLTEKVPRKNGRFRKKIHHIPLTKTNNERLSDDEITAILQLLAAVVNENESKKRISHGN